MFGDLIKIGWITSKPNIEKVTQDLVKLDADTCDTVVILDLFSHFRDGTRYHMGGGGRS
jgi:hypothetical protein